MPVLQIFSVLLCLTAGSCIFLMLLNRVLILLRDGSAKIPILLSCFAAVMGSCALYGFIFYHFPGILFAPTILTLILLGELRRLIIRYRCSASPPLDTVPHSFKISAPVTTTEIITHRYHLPHAKWKGRPLRIVHLTDLHFHTGLPLEYYQKVLKTAEDAQADIALFTGDYIDAPDALPQLAEILRPIGKLKTYAVLGNHDYWTDTEAVRKIIRDNGLHLLTNESDTIQFGQNKIIFSGRDYPWGNGQKPIPAEQDKTALHIILSHTPDNIYRAAKISADIMFSGHCHAGQIRIPRLGPIVVPSIYGRRFDHGHFKVKSTHLFVAAGIGVANQAFRIFCRPDIFTIDITKTHPPESK
jgi:predicted MPP superfamily phosphohydrolase